MTGRLVIGNLPAFPPNPLGTVIKCEFDSEPVRMPEPDLSTWIQG